MNLELQAWTPSTAALDAPDAAAIAESGLVAVEITDQPGQWTLRPDSRVGVALGDGWELRVRPRIAIPQLFFLLSYVGDREGWHDESAAFADDEDLFSAVAAGFAHHAERAIRPAPLAGYVSVEDTTPTLRGRLRIPDQIARWAGRPLPLEVSYDEFSPDILENRLVLGATQALLHTPLVAPRVRSRLLRIRAALDDVTAARPSRTAREPLLTRLNERYAAALRLAVLILQGSGIAAERGSTRAAAFVFDMNSVFEDFLTRALRDALRPHGALLVAQDDSLKLDHQGRIRLKPDVTVWRDGACSAVVDAKYKPLTTPGFPNADAYQMLAYCTAFGLERGTLVYAKDEIAGDRVHSVRNTKIDIEVRALDVTLPPNALLAQVDALAAELVVAGSASHF